MSNMMVHMFSAEISGSCATRRLAVCLSVHTPASPNGGGRVVHGLLDRIRPHPSADSMLVRATSLCDRWNQIAERPAFANDDPEMPQDR